MRFDRKKFFDAYRKEFGKLNVLQVDGLNRLLNGIENDPFITQIPEAAYLLATTKHETAHTFQPIHEYGGKSYFIRRYGGQTRKGKELGNDTPEEGYYYAGKGDVQLTGESNYEKAEVAIRREYPEVVADFERRTGKIFDLTIGDQANDTLDPQNALDPAISYAVMSYGMRTGMFTGRKLSEFIRRGKKDYVEARRTVNGKDKAQTIAGYAKKFEAILNASKISAVASNGDSAATENQLSATETPALNPSVQQPTNLVEQTVVETEGDTVTATTTTTTDTVTVTAPEPYMGVGFWAVVKRDLAAATGGNLSLSGLSEYAQQASGWPEWVVSILTKLAVGALIATAGYFIFRVIHYVIDTWKKNEKVKTEVAANTSKDRFNIEWS